MVVRKTHAHTHTTTGGFSFVGRARMSSERVTGKVVSHECFGHFDDSDKIQDARSIQYTHANLTRRSRRPRHNPCTRSSPRTAGLLTAPYEQSPSKRETRQGRATQQQCSQRQASIRTHPRSQSRERIARTFIQPRRTHASVSLWSGLRVTRVTVMGEDLGPCVEPP